MNHWVKEPLAPPHTCAIIPGRGASSEPRGFYDTRVELAGIDPHVYISMAGAERLAEEINWVPEEKHEQAKERIAELESQVEMLEAQLTELDAVVDAVDVIESKGFRARRKPGRTAKPKQPVEA